MKELKDSREIYEMIPIPEELDRVVTNRINDYAVKEKSDPKANHKIRAGIVARYTFASAAGILIFFIVALNSNKAFANAAGSLPVIGGIAKVLTIRSYQISSGNSNISVNVPEIVIDNANNQPNSTGNLPTGQEDDSTEIDNLPTAVDINNEINEIVNDYLADAETRLQADKDAFIATGGTEEDWAARDLKINVDYEVKYQQEGLLSLILTTDESWYSAYDLKYFYNLDLTKDRRLTLIDILGEDYATIANESIINQMKQRAEEDSNFVYWGITEDVSEIDGFTTVNEDTKFYLNEDGKPVVCFMKYEVAPGFMGAQEFVIN